ncbi:MAG TPA: protein kinase [Xanthomonadaceae bacterium]|nr:protein kinase [Xanthomonadaceae bacterium]
MSNGETDRPTGGEATATGRYAAASLRAGAVLAGRFRIERVLGIGGMGVVYRAHDQQLDVPVAIKVLRPELADRPEAFQRFRQELLLARQVSSPHVVRIHDIAVHEGMWLISMDLVAGESLERYLDRNAPLPAERVANILRQLAEALAAAHARGVVHRDLKPANALIDPDGNVVVTDFGVARSLGAGGLTATGAVVGTPDYLSPEQARAERIDARSDLYALGLIGYEMLTGELPFSGGTPAENLVQRLAREPPPVSAKRPETPDWLARLIMQLLRQSPARRIPSARAVVAAIDQQQLPRRGGLLAAVLGAGLLLAVTFGSWLAQPWMQGQAPPAEGIERVIVLPVAGGDDAALMAALTDHLRAALAEHPGIAVVDTERTAQALAQLGARMGAVPDLSELMRLTIASTAIRPRLQAVAGGGHRIEFTITTEDSERVVAGGEAASAVDAVQAGRSLLLQSLGAGSPLAPVPRLPADERALRAYGEGVLARRRGDLDAAVEQFTAATVVAPEYTQAWVALAETAFDIGNRPAALNALLSGLRQLAGERSPARLGNRMRSMRALIEGRPAAAAALLEGPAGRALDDTELALWLAAAHGEAGALEPAIRQLQALVERDPGDPRAWYLLGKLSILHGDARPAIEDHLVRAQVLYNRSGNDLGRAETLNALGVGYERLGQIEQARDHYGEAVQLRERIGDRRGLAASLRNLAAMAAIGGDFAAAERDLERARGIYEAVRNRRGLADLDNELGFLAEERGRFADALEHFRRSLQARQQLGDPLGVAESLNNVGYSYFQQGEYDNAQVYWRQAEDAFAGLDDLNGLARVRQNLALLAIVRGEPARAASLLQESLALAERQQMLEEAAVSLRNLADLERLEGRHAEALDHLQRAEQLFTERDDRRGLADAALLRARIALAMGDVGQADRILGEHGEELLEANPEQRTLAALLESEIALARDDRTGAGRALASAREQSRAAGVRALELRLDLAEAAIGNGEIPLDALRRLGHVELVLLGLERAIARAIEIDDAAGAVSLYEEARTALERLTRYGRAFVLHLLGARAQQAAGMQEASRRALQAARTELDRVTAAMPEDAREGFLAQPAAAGLRQAEDPQP